MLLLFIVFASPHVSCPGSLLVVYANCECLCVYGWRFFFYRVLDRFCSRWTCNLVFPFVGWSTGAYAAALFVTVSGCHCPSPSARVGVKDEDPDPPPNVRLMGGLLHDENGCKLHHSARSGLQFRLLALLCLCGG